MLLKFRIYLFAFITAFVLPGHSYSQNTKLSEPLKINPDTLTAVEDTALIRSDTTSTDTTKVKKKKNNDEFKSRVTYSARDSSSFSQVDSKFYLYGDGKIEYEDIELKADYIEYDMTNNMVFASGVKDSTGKLTGKPEFKKGKETFKSESLYYNFKSKKGIIRNIITEQEGGFLHAEKTKREADGTIDIKNGEYTTCNAEHPHFYLALTKGIVIPDKKIVSGPAYLVLEDIPLPIAIPFGFFPNKRGATSGIIMPSFGQSNNRGFSLTGGGVYLALSKYYDLAVTGDVYTKGTWGVNVSSRYVKKYKYSGNFAISNYVTKTGTVGIHTGTDAEQISKARSIIWSHAQDAKANPTSHFSASVNYNSTKYDQNVNYTDAQALITSAKSSSIAYSKSWTNSNLTVNLHGSQSHNPGSSNLISLGLPNMSFTANRIYPFKRKDAAGEKQWYEDININYSAQLDNNMSAKEDTIFTKTGWHDTWKRKSFGFKHSVPLSTNFKVLKYFNISPSLSYTAMLYDMKIHKRDTFDIDTANRKVYYIKTDTIPGLTYAQGFAPSLSISFNPTFYGMFAFGKFTKIRHVLTPSVSFSFIPGLKGFFPDYSRSIQADTAKHIAQQNYTIYDSNPYRAPQSSATHSGSFSFNVGNNLEMKVRSDKDTITGTKKIVLIQSFNLSSGYNIYAIGNKLSPIGMSGSSPIFKNFSVTYNGNLDPYAIGTFGQDTIGYYWKQHHKIGRITNAGISFGYTFQGGGPKQTGDKNNTGTQQPPDKAKEAEKTKKSKGDFDYFKIPWSLTFAYNLNYTKTGFTSQTIQGLTVNGNFSLTSKWKFNFNSGYDFKAKKIIQTTSFSIQRDLHCWVMSLNVAPIGQYRYYFFKISVLSSFLNDLKYEQHKNFYDYSGYNGY